MAKTRDARPAGDGGPAGKKRGGALSVSEIGKDKITQLAAQHWSSEATRDGLQFSEELVEKILREELSAGRGGALRRLQLLELSRYLESYLWPGLPEDGAASAAHIISIAAMVNQKFREGVAAWEAFRGSPAKFAAFFRRFLDLRREAVGAVGRSAAGTFAGQTYLQFAVNAFQSLEEEAVRAQVLRLVSLPLWHALSPGRLALELHEHADLVRHWRHAQRREAKAAAADPAHVPVAQRPEAAWLPGLVDDFLARVSGGGDAKDSGDGGAVLSKRESNSVPPTGDADDVCMEEPADATEERQAADPTTHQPEHPATVRALTSYCERFAEFLVDLLSQLPTRRFAHAVLDERAVLSKCERAVAAPATALAASLAASAVFRQLLDLLRLYLTFPVDDHSGEALSDDEVVSRHYERVQALQRLLFRRWPELRELALASCARAQRRDVLADALRALPLDRLRRLVTRQLRLVRDADASAGDAAFLIDAVGDAYERRRLQSEAVNALPLYPTEALLFDEASVPSVAAGGALARPDRVLALPKLNLQFLTLQDYLLRNFHLFRLEATYEVREDVADALSRVRPFLKDDDEVGFGGWARMALPVTRFGVTEVRPPRVGEARPAAVTAELVLDLKAMRPDVRDEWESVKEHDVLFLLTVRPPDALSLAAAERADVDVDEDAAALLLDADGSALSATAAALRRHGLRRLRGCEVVEVRDEAGNLLNDFTGRTRPDQVKGPKGTLRTLTVALDAAQYQLDAEGPDAAEACTGFNLVVRRRPKENNFKAVLESIRDLINADCAVPEWLLDTLLGYGDPAAGQYQNLEGTLQTVDFRDTFLDEEHVRASFPSYEVSFTSSRPDGAVVPPFRLTFPPFGEAREAVEPATRPAIVAEAYPLPDPGPYPEDVPPTNRVRFTPVQTSAILSAVQPGLTLVVGPPGTGKTDTAVQALHLLYHNRPQERTLILAHSNQALNDLFAKLVERDVPPRYMLRLGMGEAELETEEAFSRVGRVNAMLARRLELLAEVARLARSLGVSSHAEFTCETAAHFWLLHVLARWERYADAARAAHERGSESAARDLFPFAAFFADTPQPVFASVGVEAAVGLQEEAQAAAEAAEPAQPDEPASVEPSEPTTAATSASTSAQQAEKEVPSASPISFAADMERARGCFRHLRRVFQELEEVRPFELLRSQADRINYLLTKQAKIVAMTCTHAALKRREFLSLGFKYDNLVMEESAQVLEIETFIPMLLQRADDGVAALGGAVALVPGAAGGAAGGAVGARAAPRLKRVVLVGDHHQLPPVVKNVALQRYSHLDQPMFTRFIRLGTPFIELDAQGRARPSIAKLYNWRYRALGDLPHVAAAPEFAAANPGLRFDYQLVDVPDYRGRGEHCPMPYFYQNLGEAEYLVSLYQYMRLLGYPARDIAVLSTYNGQAALLRDVLQRRCGAHPAFGMPGRVATVDKFQGQQAKYVLLSLVRTTAFGHLRDVRRLVVALSRARLGLYVFARAALFAECHELAPAFSQLLARPTRLALVPGERYGETRRPVDAEPPSVAIMPDGDALAALVASMVAQWEAMLPGGGDDARGEEPMVVEEQVEEQDAPEAKGQDERDFGP